MHPPSLALLLAHVLPVIPLSFRHSRLSLLTPSSYDGNALSLSSFVQLRRGHAVIPYAPRRYRTRTRHPSCCGLSSPDTPCSARHPFSIFRHPRHPRASRGMPSSRALSRRPHRWTPQLPCRFPFLPSSPQSMPSTPPYSSPPSPLAAIRGLPVIPSRKSTARHPLRTDTRHPVGFHSVIPRPAGNGPVIPVTMLFLSPLARGGLRRQRTSGAPLLSLPVTPGRTETTGSASC